MTCEVCGGPIHGSNRTGICSKSPECNRARRRRTQTVQGGIDRSCELCGKPIWSTNTVGVCARQGQPECLKEYNRRKKRAIYNANPDLARQKNRDWFARNPDRCEIYSQRTKQRNGTPTGRAKTLLQGARKRARDEGVDFDLTLEWMEAELTRVMDVGCPYLGIPVRLDGTSAHRDNSPTVERIHAGEAYTQDNCIIVSYRANRIKNDASFEELVMLTKNLGVRLGKIKAAS